MTERYILDENNNPVPCPDLMKWGKWLEDNKKRKLVKQENIGDYFVSTVFLGLDHNFFDKGEPILYETMVFHKTKKDLQQKRYTDKLLALQGHEDIVKGLLK